MQMTTTLRYLIAALAGAATGLLITQTLVKLESSLEKEIIRLSNNAYLNGFKVWDFERNQTFKRLARYLGCGVCYEASVILMFLLKEHRKTRYVFGYAYSHSEKKVFCHAWIEIKAYGLWWVIDSTWWHPIRPMPRAAHYAKRRVRVVRKITDQELFSNENASKMAEMIKEPKTSYIFHDLCYFRWACWESDTDECKEMVFERLKEFELPTDGEWQNLFHVDIFKKGRPITQEILAEFVAHDRRLLPKRRAFRRARTLAKTVSCCKEEMTKLREKTDAPMSVKFTSIKSFEILENAPS